MIRVGVFNFFPSPPLPLASFPAPNFCSNDNDDYHNGDDDYKALIDPFLSALPVDRLINIINKQANKYTSKAIMFELSQLHSSFPAVIDVAAPYQSCGEMESKGES